jgi:hypothetical protein
MAELEFRYQKAIADIGKVARKWQRALPEGSYDRLSGYTAHTKPGQYGGVLINGRGDRGHEDFALREHFSQNIDQFNFCKTARKPYDCVVVAALAILKHRLDDAIDVGSDGGAEDWDSGVALARSVTRLAIKNPIQRGGVVAVLEETRRAFDTVWAEAPAEVRESFTDKEAAYGLFTFGFSYGMQYVTDQLDIVDDE